MARLGAGSVRNDGELLEAARRGDMSCLGELFESYRGMVVGVCAGVLGRSHLLADAVQEVFLKLLLSAGDIRDGTKVGPWLGTVVLTVVLVVLEIPLPFFGNR